MFKSFSLAYVKMRERYLGENTFTDTHTQTHTVFVHNCTLQCPIAGGRPRVMQTWYAQNQCATWCLTEELQLLSSALISPSTDSPLSICVKCIASSLEVLCNWTDLKWKQIDFLFFARLLKIVRCVLQSMSLLNPASGFEMSTEKTKKFTMCNYCIISPWGEKETQSFQYYFLIVWRTAFWQQTANAIYC